MSKDLVNLKGNSVQLKMDMPIEQFRYFTRIIQNNILNEWITTKKVDKIKEKLQQFISDIILEQNDFIKGINGNIQLYMTKIFQYNFGCINKLNKQRVNQKIYLQNQSQKVYVGFIQILTLFIRYISLLYPFSKCQHYTYQSEYIIIIAVKPAYNLSHKKNRYLMIKIEDITIFIYLAKPVDYFQFSQFKSIQTKLQGITKENNVTEPILISQKNISEQEMESIQKLKQCLNEIIILDYDNWETDLVVAARSKLHQLFQTGFWHLFCAKKITTIVDLKTNERYLEFQFDKKNSQYKLIAFQKKGPNFNLLEHIILGFCLRILQINIFTQKLILFNYLSKM